MAALSGVTDTIRSYETPEGISLRLKLAGPVVRACAWMIDLLIRGCVYGLLLAAASLFGGVGDAMMLIALFLMEWFYPVVFELIQGATPGKRAMGLLVINSSGTPVSASASLLRNLLRGADFLPFFYGVGLLTMLAGRDFQRLGDLAAGTLVVYRENHQASIEIPTAESRAPEAAFTPDELQSIIRFAERSRDLTAERTEELASILEQVTGLKGREGVERLISYANWLVRGR